MISIGTYVIQCNTLKMDPESKCRHEVVRALVPYWAADQRSKFLDGKNKLKNSLTSKKNILYAMNVAEQLTVERKEI